MVLYAQFLFKLHKNIFEVSMKSVFHDEQKMTLGNYKPFITQVAVVVVGVLVANQVQRLLNKSKLTKPTEA